MQGIVYMPIMKRCKAESTSGDDDATPACPASFPLEMPDTVSNVSIPYLPAEPHPRLNSDNHPSATLASSSPEFGGRGSTRAASSQSVARALRVRALVLPTRYRDATLIDPPKPASVLACGKLKSSVSRCSVIFMDNLLPRKEEPVELPAVSKLSDLRMTIEEARLAEHDFVET